jgi:hypothetical protein
MAAEDPTTWGEVCKNVGFRDNLYRTCREKVPEFVTGASLMRAPGDDEGAEDFDKRLFKKALPIPAPPSADWAEEEEEDGFLSFLEEFSIEKIVVYGGLAAAIWWFFLRNPQSAAAQPATSAAPAAAQPATSIKAA